MGTACIYGCSEYTPCSLAAAQYTSSTIKHLFEVMIICSIPFYSGVFLHLLLGDLKLFEL